MKKLLTLILSGSMLLSLLLCGCQSTETAQKSTQETDASASDAVLDYFYDLANIPRPTHHEEQVSQYLCSWFKERDFSVVQDAVGNVIAEIPATEGYESLPLTILQAHMDMVAVGGEGFDPLTDPIVPILSGDTLTADGTSLGADDGIGVATALYVADTKNEVSHGPLRIIITVDEEDGMTGIFNLDANYVTDAIYAINLDAETLGEVTISSAAGQDVTFTRNIGTQAPSGKQAVSLSISGLLGGHSGLQIGKGRCNANVALCDVLMQLKEAGLSYELADFHGGSARNAIPSEATATLVLAPEQRETLETTVAESQKSLSEIYAESDPDVKLSIEDAELPAQVLRSEDTNALIELGTGIVDGVYSMSEIQEGLVESSSNLGILKTDSDKISGMALFRSSSPEKMTELCDLSRQLAEQLDFVADFVETAKAWPVRQDNKLEALASSVYEELTGENAKSVTLHAGLECGSFSEMNPNLTIISIGPTLTGVHTPEETLTVSSVGIFTDWLCGILVSLEA